MNDAARKGGKETGEPRCRPHPGADDFRGRGVRLVPPPYFEGPQWRLECTFQGGKDLARALRTVAVMTEQPQFQRVLEGQGRVEDGSDGAMER